MGLNGFCKDELWNDFLPINNKTDISLPTECFSHTVLIAIPCLVFWLQVPKLIIEVNNSRKHSLPWTTLQGLKWLFSSIMIVVMILNLINSIWNQFQLDEDIPSIDMIYPVILIITLLAIMIAMNKLRKAGSRSSGTLFVAWLTLLVCATPELITWINKTSDPNIKHSSFRYYIFLVYYASLAIELFLNFFADPLTIFRTNETNCPEQSASFLNRLVLWWLNPLIAKGQKGSIEVEDLFDLDDEMQADVLAKKWKQHWSISLRDYNSRRRAFQKSKERTLNSQPLLNTKGKKKTYGSGECDDNDIEPTDKEVPLPSVLKTLWTIFKWKLMGCAVLRFFSDILAFANPAFLSLLIAFTEDVNASWHIGVTYAILLFVCAELRSFFMASFNYNSLRIGHMVQMALTTAVYEKTLRLSNEARRQKTHGEIVNLMAIDVDKYKMLTPLVQHVWSSPMQIIACIFLLYRILGVSVFAGVVIMIALVPVTVRITTTSKQWTAQQMKLKDDRVRLTNETLNGVKVVKLYGWEPALEKAIDDIRLKEMNLIRKAALIKLVADVLNISSPLLVACASFTGYTLLSEHNVLTPQIAFVAITLFSQLRGPLLMGSALIHSLIQIVVSNKRMKEFLVASELKEKDIDRQTRAELFDKTVEMDGASFTWDSTAPNHIQNLSFEVERGQLIAVVGTVAAGKSSLLSSLLGEMEKIRGYVGVRGMAAFVPQQPWILHQSFRENILMELPFDKVKYNKIIEACCLKTDISNLPNGDMTEIGEKGINLSGGQKARVALARAVYQDRDIYLLDDPLSAVDAHVARHIFQNVIGPNGMLAKKTRILVTHGLSFLKDCDKVAVMSGGSISHIDTYNNLIEDENISQILKEADLKNSDDSSSNDSSVDSMAFDSNTVDDEDDLDADMKSETNLVNRQASRISRVNSSGKDPEVVNMIEKEAVATGRVQTVIYLDYFRSMGLYMCFIPFIIAMALQSMFVMARGLWLANWSNDGPEHADKAGFRVIGFVSFGFVEIMLFALSMSLIIYGGVRASLNLHTPLLHNILRCALSFFDVTPLGRILNRLGKDMDVVDLHLPQQFHFLTTAFFNIIQICIIISISTPLFIAFIIPIFVLYGFLLKYFVNSSRQLQRLASVNRSPIYSHFGESIQGVSTIRAFNWSDMFIEQNKQTLMRFMKCMYLCMISACWLSVRLEVLGNTLILATTLLSVWSKYNGTMTAGFIGLSVSYSLDITFLLNIFIRFLSEVESNIVSVERIREYTFMDTEADWQSQKLLPRGWPTNGKIEIVNYSTRYRPGLDLVLRGLNLNIAPGEKVGVVGRTGAGKSSLALALFRIIEPAGGQIIIDDVDISTIGLHDLRANLTIIPQDPVLFSGTLRFNLDTLGYFDDSDLWAALEHSNLKPFVEQLPMGLDHKINESGDNISVGQRQLVCLTRALLRKSRILVLDEATAAVDVHTDSLIQTTIRKEFTNSTVITIAHRLNTIMDYDKILVMDGGRTAEYDSPQNLLANKKSIFYSMAQTAGLV